jgi:hypothetical protein
MLIQYEEENLMDYHHDNYIEFLYHKSKVYSIIVRGNDRQLTYRLFII